MTKKLEPPKRLTHSTAEEIKKLEEQEKEKNKQQEEKHKEENSQKGKSGNKSKKAIDKDAEDHDDVSAEKSKPPNKGNKAEIASNSSRKWKRTVNSDKPVKRRQRGIKSEKFVDDPNTSNTYVSNSNYEEDNSQDEGFKCHICSKTFRRADEFKEHKLNFTKLKKKLSCPKCPKGFTQKALLDQHYDYYHTNKPKNFVCKLCNKDFPLKKSYLEHNRQLHNDGDYKYVCDICGHRLFVKGEYTCHRISHTKLKPYACGICNKSAFATPGQLNAHVNRCRKEPTHECSKCGKKFSSKQCMEK